MVRRATTVSAGTEPVSAEQAATAGRRYGPFEAVLFDCDGVLVDSRGICRDTWTQWATRMGVPSKSIVERLQGRPIREAMSELIPSDRLDGEVEWFEAMELRFASAVRAAPGARRVVNGLPGRKWAVVTSASRVLARARLAAAGLTLPRVLISADDVKAGKPSPDCYSLAASRLGVAIDRCIVFEDSSVGARAANRAGATVVGVGATIDAEFHIGPVADLCSIELFAIRRGEVQLRVYEGRRLHDN
jgi:sugar-phosphatase